MGDGIYQRAFASYGSVARAFRDDERTGAAGKRIAAEYLATLNRSARAGTPLPAPPFALNPGTMEWATKDSKHHGEPVTQQMATQELDRMRQHNDAMATAAQRAHDEKIAAHEQQYQLYKQQQATLMASRSPYTNVPDWIVGSGAPTQTQMARAHQQYQQNVAQQYQNAYQNSPFQGTYQQGSLPQPNVTDQASKYLALTTPPYGDKPMKTQAPVTPTETPEAWLRRRVREVSWLPRAALAA